MRPLILLALAAAPLVSYGDAPPAAPAGKRQPGDSYTGYSGKKWERHYGVVNGRCNRDAVGAALGAGSAPAGKDESRPIAMLAGSVAGAIAGAKIGRDMDPVDRACFGHALELTGDKKPVTWTSPDQRRTYRLTPVRGFAREGVRCREFDFRVTTDGGKQTNRVTACPASDGTWRLLG